MKVTRRGPMRLDDLRELVAAEAPRLWERLDRGIDRLVAALAQDRATETDLT